MIIRELVKLWPLYLFLGMGSILAWFFGLAWFMVFLLVCGIVGTAYINATLRKEEMERDESLLR